MKKYLLVIFLTGFFSIIANAQKVGVSDATGLTPQSLLHVHNSAAGQLLQLTTVNTTGGNSPTVNSGFNISIDGSKNIVFNQYEAAKMAFYTNNTERLTVLSDGNVGIGTAAPASKLDINGNVNVAAGNGTRVTIGAPTSSGAAMLIGRLSGNPSIKSTDTYLMLEGGGASGIVGLNYYATGAVLLAYGGGNVGIGTTSPTQKLDVNGVVNAATGYRIANAAATGGNYLRGNGTNFVASGIQVSDVPVLNQNTTGTAANVTGIVAPSNGGTGVNNGSNTLIIPASGTAVLGTGTTNYNTYWSGTNTLGSEQFVNVSRGGLGANMTATAIGAIPYASSTSAYSTLPAVASGNALISGGTGTAPSWGKIGLTTHISGTLAVGNGGTGTTTLTGYVYGNGAGAMTASTTIPTSALSSSTITVSSSGTGLSITGSPVALGGTVTVNSNATSANTASTLVARDGSGNFSASQINANLLGLLKMTDNRVISPSAIAAGSLQFGFTSLNNNNTAPYGDFLHLRSYTDASGGNDNLIVFRKDAIGMRIYQQAFGSATAYSTYKDVAFTQDVATGYIQNQTAADQAAGFRINGNGIFNGGNVGIGTTSPSEKLDIAGNINLQNLSTGRRDIRGTMADNDFWSIGANSTASNAGVLEIATGDDGQAAGSAEPIVVRQYGPGSPWSGTLVRTAYLLDAYGYSSFPGNVGIGTTSPTAKLHISAGDGSLALFGPNTSWGGKLFVGAAPNQNVASTAQVISTDGNLHLDPAPSKNMYLGYYQARDIYINPNGGNVGIGTTGPGQKLVVSGGNEDIIASGGGLRLGANNWSDAGPTYGHIITSNSGHNALMIVGNNVAGNSGRGREVKVWDYLNVQGAFNITGQFVSVGNTTMVTNLNADYLDGYHYSSFATSAHTHTLDNVCDAGNTTDQNVYFNNGSPTIYLQDNDNRSGMIHMNSNLLYFLSGSGTNSTSWATNGSYWPLTINMTSDESTFGGAAYFMEGNVGIGTTTPAYKLHVPSGYIGTDYINTTDNAVGSGVTGIMVKAGDNYHRTANAAAVLSFLGVTSPTGDNLGNHTATTTLNMNNNQLVIKPDVTANIASGIHWNGAGDYSYAIYEESGAWSNPYPDLNIAFHTGIKIGAHSSYGGMRFYNNSDMATLVMSINDAVSGAGANNVYMAYDVGIGTTSPTKKLQVNGTFGVDVDNNASSPPHTGYVASADIAYSRDDISGWTAGPSGDDVVSGAIPIFSFNMFGTDYTTLYISTNGWVSFGSAGSSISPYALPSSYFSMPLICVYARDMVTRGNGIRYTTVGTSPNRTFIIDFEIETYSTGYDVTAQLQLHETSNLINIRYYYTAPEACGQSSATIGIQGAGGSVATAVPISYNGKVLDDNANPQSVSFSPVKY